VSFHKKSVSFCGYRLCAKSDRKVTESDRKDIFHQNILDGMQMNVTFYSLDILVIMMKKIIIIST